MNKDKKHIGFRRLSMTTLVAVYVLIMVGGIVRSTGAGMGCPDWPTCFGRLAPPTDVSELPADYKEFYANYRHEKNIRFARYLRFFGMNDKADRIIYDDKILEEADFNPVKTWTEYFNRLMGAAVGFLVFATMVMSYRYRHEDKAVFRLSVFIFLLVGFEGWIGSVVVSTKLTPWVITLHMVLALAIVLLLVYLNFRIREQNFSTVDLRGNSMVKRLFYICLVVMGVQIVMGTQVREVIDGIAADLSYTLRETWMSKMDPKFYFHRTFSLVILGVHIWLVAVILRMGDLPERIKNGGKLIVLLILIEIVSGIIMAYFHIPPFVQPVHLLLSTLIFGGLYYLYLVMMHSKDKIIAT